MPEKLALSRVTAALKRATWAADWVAAQGRFVWHDLMTTDAPAARAFYTELFGWGVQELNMGGFTVLLLKNGERSIGTIMPETSLPSSHWMPYVAVADVDAACRRAVELGGAVGVPATNVPKLGRLAVVTDPHGGAFSPLKRPSEAGPPPDPASVAAGDFCWEELATPNAEAAAAFYGSLFNWKIEPMPMAQPYWTAKNDGAPVAGITPAPDPSARPRWLPYIAVADVDDTAARATALGASVATAPTDIPGLGRFAILTDPVGAAFALYRASSP
jgi:predicted enzyme related to lactoylglutathione lyase